MLILLPPSETKAGRVRGKPSDPERISFPELPANLIAKPTLVWLLGSGAPKQKVEVTYLTQSPLNAPLPLEGGEALMMYMRHVVQKVRTYVHAHR